MNADTMHDYERVFSRHGEESTRIWAKFMDDPESVTPEEAAVVSMSIEERKERENVLTDEMLFAMLKEWPEGTFVPADDIVKAMMYAGRVMGPKMLYVLDLTGRIAPDDYVELVPSVWSLAEYPGLSMGRPDWLKLWKKSGFTIDHVRVDRPVGVRRLWRVARPKYKRGLSWTDDVVYADKFMKLRNWDKKHRMYVADVQPENLLARIHEAGRGEAEWIVNTAGVTIEEVPR